jgi:hypothetical protein
MHVRTPLIALALVAALMGCTSGSNAPDATATEAVKAAGNDDTAAAADPADAAMPAAPIPGPEAGAPPADAAAAPRPQALPASEGPVPLDAATAPQPPQPVQQPSGTPSAQ